MTGPRCPHCQAALSPALISQWHGEATGKLRTRNAGWPKRPRTTWIFLPLRRLSVRRRCNRFHGFLPFYAPRTLAEVIGHATRPGAFSTERYERWILHYQNRIAYERAMLAEGGGLAAERFELAVGGRVQTSRRGGDWYVITKLNRKAGQLVSVSVIGRYATVVPVEEIKDYQAPAEGDAEKIAQAVKPLPLVNWRAPGCVEMNPPFENGADIRHIEHARKFLKPGGRLVAICANGPRQQAKLKPMAEESGGWYEPLPPGTFAESGTMVNAALLGSRGRTMRRMNQIHIHMYRELTLTFPGGSVTITTGCVDGGHLTTRVDVLANGNRYPGEPEWWAKQTAGNKHGAALRIVQEKQP